MKLVDTHAHLDFVPKDTSVENWLGGAKENGIFKIISVGTSIDTTKKAIKIAEKFSDDDLQIFASAGIHAEDGMGDVKKYGENYIDELKKVVQSSGKIVAIGECGFDIRFDDGKQTTTDEEIKFQKELFEAQIKLAMELDLPLVVHCRNAWAETFNLIEQFRGTSSPMPTRGRTSKLSGVFHSWTGDWEAAEKALDLGFYISFSGIVTFKNAPNVADVAKRAPIERIVVETDSPYLTPEPFRGFLNEPKNVRITAEFVAKLKNIPFDEFCEITSENAERLFNFTKYE
ncbi:MAG TPA: TatD family hydrolase [Candidatus Saccharimonadales bacterium]|nr:TatD family hydrolase [Candidatus Saccharimonadales bacterium]